MHAPNPSPQTVPTASGVLDPELELRGLVKCSTHELTGKTQAVLIRRLDTPGGARCSLERR